MTIGAAGREGSSVLTAMRGWVLFATTCDSSTKPSIISILWMPRNGSESDAETLSCVWADESHHRIRAEPSRKEWLGRVLPSLS